MRSKSMVGSMRPKNSRVARSSSVSAAALHGDFFVVEWVGMDIVVLGGIFGAAVVVVVVVVDATNPLFLLTTSIFLMRRMKFLLEMGIGVVVEKSSSSVRLFTPNSTGCFSSFL